MPDLSPNVAPPPSTPPETVSESVDPFQSVFRMSTTAGLGSGDYLAINGLAVASVFLGVASAAVLINELGFLFLPAFAAVCAVLGLRAISNSNGTQTGRELAVVGLLLALGFGGYATFAGVRSSVRTHGNEKAISTLIHSFGAKIRAGDYPAAYALCDDDFRTGVPELYFANLWQAIGHNGVRGEMASIDWTGRLAFEANAVTGIYQSTGVAVISFGPNVETLRINFLFSQFDGHWAIDQIPVLFPPDNPTRAPKSAPMGPPAPGHS